jgi:hypothetical protein
MASFSNKPFLNALSGLWVDAQSQLKLKLQITDGLRVLGSPTSIGSSEYVFLLHVQGS